MKDSVVIRDMRPNDAARVAVLISELTINILEPGELVARIEHMAAVPHGYRRNLVIVVSEVIVGHVQLSWYDIPSKGLIGRLEELIVTQASFRTDAIKALMHEVLSLATKLSLREVKVTTPNPELFEIYTNSGFVHKVAEHLLIWRP